MLVLFLGWEAPRRVERTMKAKTPMIPITMKVSLTMLEVGSGQAPHFAVPVRE